MTLVISSSEPKSEILVQLHHETNFTDLTLFCVCREYLSLGESKVIIIFAIANFLRLLFPTSFEQKNWLKSRYLSTEFC